MRFNCGMTAEQKWNAQYQWHTKFLWWPTRMPDNKCYWLEYCDRRLIRWSCISGFIWEYRITP